MSWLSNATGVHISPHGVHVEPLKALGTALTVGSFGGLGPVAGALSHIPGASAVGGALGKIPGVAKVGGILSNAVHGGAADPEGDALYGTDTSPDSGGGFLSAAGGYLKKALGGVNPINAALGAAGVVNAGQLGAKANKFANEAYGNAQQSYAERAGLRKAGIEGMLNPVTPDTSYLSKIRSNNAYAGGQ